MIELLVSDYEIGTLEISSTSRHCEEDFLEVNMLFTHSFWLENMYVGGSYALSLSSLSF